MSHISSVLIPTPGPPAPEPEEFVTDSGTATPNIDDEISILGAHNMTVSASGNVVTIADANAHVLGDLTPLAAGQNALIVQTGRINMQDAGVWLPATTADAAQGIIEHDNQPILHTFPTANRNLFYGLMAGNLTNDAVRVIGIGNEALNSVTTSNNTICIGHQSGRDITSGSDNVAIGHISLRAGSTSAANVAVGYQALASLQSGTHNIAIGANAGLAYTSSESSNIMIRNSGVTGDNNTIRIGTQGSGNGQQDKCIIRRIFGVAPGAGSRNVIIDPDGKLGTFIANDLESAFIADLSATENPPPGPVEAWDVGSSSGYTITTNIGSDFSGITYTAPLSGWYHFLAWVKVSGLVNNIGGYLQITTSHSDPNFIVDLKDLRNVRNPTDDTSGLYLNYFVRLDQTDTAKLVYQFQQTIDNTTHVDAPGTWFAGYYVGP
jgi:hypothetical protein